MPQAKAVNPSERRNDGDFGTEGVINVRVFI